MTQLVKYEAARVALSEASSIDEVKGIRDKVEALAAYARLARDTNLVSWATEIKVRAERRAGEMLMQSEKAPGSRGTGSNQYQEVRSDDGTAPKLAELGITKNNSSNWQRLAAMPEKKFEDAIVVAKAGVGEVTTAFMLREARGPITHAVEVKQDAPPSELSIYRNWHKELTDATGIEGRKEILEYVRELVMESA